MTVYRLGLFAIVLATGTGYAVPAARAQCNSRPGTPDLVEAEAVASDRIEFRWRNTTGRPVPTQVHTAYFDISVRDEAGNVVHGDVAGMGPLSVVYRGWSSHTLGGVPPGATRCFSIRGRTAAGTQGCVSQVFSAQVCAKTATPEIDQICRPYAVKAYEQVMTMGKMQQTATCKGPPEDPRWSTDQFQHYGWCVRTRFAGTTRDVTETNARNEMLRNCRPKAVKDPARQPPPPPTVPVAPGMRCSAGVSMTLEDCRNHDGTAVENWDFKGLSPACGLGANEEQAVENAIESYKSIGLTVKDEPGPGECGYTFRSIPACSCDPGVSTRMYTTKSAPLKPAPGAGGGPGSGPGGGSGPGQSPRGDILAALGGVGVDYSVPQAQIRGWIDNSFTPYRAVSEVLLTLLAGKRLKQPVELDVIVWNYENGPGGSSPRVAADVDPARLRASVVAAYNNRYGSAEQDFQRLLH
jgi:hypothetical protein